MVEIQWTNHMVQTVRPPEVPKKHGTDHLDKPTWSNYIDWNRIKRGGNQPPGRDQIKIKKYPDKEKNL